MAYGKYDWNRFDTINEVGLCALRDLLPCSATSPLFNCWWLHLECLPHSAILQQHRAPCLLQCVNTAVWLSAKSQAQIWSSSFQLCSPHSLAPICQLPCAAPRCPCRSQPFYFQVPSLHPMLLLLTAQQKR